MVVLFKQNQELSRKVSVLTEQLNALRSTPLPESPVVNEPVVPEKDSSSKRFVDSINRVSFDWPTGYELTQVTSQDLVSSISSIIAKFRDSSNKAVVKVFVAKSPFGMSQIRQSFAPTGLEDINPEKRVVGGKTFYYYGAGGGGVSYADQYFYNLNGKLLVFVFDGPYNSDEKSPNSSAKTVAETMLASLEVK